MISKPRRRFILSIDQELFNEIKIFADKSGLSMNGIFSAAIRDTWHKAKKDNELVVSLNPKSLNVLALIPKGTPSNESGM